MIAPSTFDKTYAERIKPTFSQVNYLVQNELFHDARPCLDGVAQIEQDESGLYRPTSEELPANFANFVTLHDDDAVDTNNFSASRYTA